MHHFHGIDMKGNQMKKILPYFLSFIFAAGGTTAIVLAADTDLKTDKLKLGVPTSSASKIIEMNVGAGSANPKIKGSSTDPKLQFSTDGVNYKAFGSGSGGASGYNLAEQGDFEGSLSTFSSVGTTATFAATAVAANVGEGLKSGAFDATTNGDAMRWQVAATVIPQRLQGNSCVVMFSYKGGDTNLVYRVTDGSGNLLANALTLVGKTAYGSAVPLGFPCPSSGSLRFEIVAAANAAPIYIENLFIGEQLFGVTSSFTPGTVFTVAAAACPAGSLPADGAPISRAQYPALYAKMLNIHGDGTKLANGTASGFSGTHFNLPDYRGRFLRGMDGGAANDPDRATRSTMIAGNNGASGDAVGSLQGDGVGPHAHDANWYQNGAAGGGTPAYPGASSGTAMSNGNTVRSNGSGIIAESRPKNINVMYCVQVEGPRDTINLSQANQFAAIRIPGGSGASWSFPATWSDPGNAGWVNKTYLGIAEPPAVNTTFAMKVSNLLPGRYKVTANARFHSASGTTCYYGIYDGTTRRGISYTDSNLANAVDGISSLVGLFEYTAVQPSLTFRVQYIRTAGSVDCYVSSGLNATEGGMELILEPMDQQRPAPYIVDMLSKNTPGSVITNNSSIGKMIWARVGTTCTTTPCAITAQSGDFVQIVRSSVGYYGLDYTGAFPGSSAACVVNGDQGGACNITGSGGGSSQSIQCRNASGTLTDSQFNVICMGLKP
jgi:Phage Tail Collar Domain